MDKKKFKQKTFRKPVEQFTNAPLANINKTAPISNVVIPSKTNVKNAKEWVDSNQK